jgi:pyruvate dehydrogenase E2 component (dihydrolipoamide acetyltransferase)
VSLSEHLALRGKRQAVMEIKLPKLGEGADSGVVVSLLVKEGDRVEKGQPVMELENEKAVASIPSPASGTVERVWVRVGDKVSVGQTLFTLADAQAAGSVAPTPRAAAAAPAPTPSASAPEPHAAAETYVVEAIAEQEAAEIEATVKPGLTPAASPSIRKIARELGIDLTKVRGSERGGRIVMADLRAYIQRLQRIAFAPKPEARPGLAPAVPAEPTDFAKWGPISRQPMSPLRQTISRRMWENWTAIPHVTQFDEADITGLNELRKRYAPEYEARGARLTLTVFVVRVVADLLKQHPVFASSLDETTQEIVLKHYYHIGLAVDTEHGLIVPVIRDADKKSLLELARDIVELADKARTRKVTLEELRGGTFTVSNQGGIGGAHFTPIINRPEVAILGLGRGALKPVVRDGQIQPRLMLPLALSYDHRVIDGGAAARFIVDLVQALQNFDEQQVKL